MRILLALILITVAACSAAPAPVVTPPVTTDSVPTIALPPSPLPPISVVSFSPFVVNNLSWAYAMWMEAGGREFAGCVYGAQIADTLFVRSMETAQIFNSTFGIVNGKCRVTNDILGTVHSHPNLPNECQFSMIDRRTMSPTLPIHIVICAPDRFVFVIKGDTTLHSSAMPRALLPDPEGKNES